MKKFVINFLSNRFGIVLAALNVCFFMSKSNMLTQPFGKLFVCVNSPAMIAALLSLELVKIFSHQTSSLSEYFLRSMFFVFFCAAQWLFIAWIAKTLAERIQHLKLR